MNTILLNLLLWSSFIGFISGFILMIVLQECHGRYRSAGIGKAFANLLTCIVNGFGGGIIGFSLALVYYIIIN